MKRPVGWANEEVSIIGVDLKIAIMRYMGQDWRQIHELPYNVIEAIVEQMMEQTSGGNK